MNHAQVMLGFNVCLFVLLPVATVVYIALLVWMGRGLLRRGKASVGAIATVVMIPATMVYIVLLIPLFYFNYLLKQERYCLDVIRVNRMHDAGHPMLQERCKPFDIPALIDEAWKTSP